MSQDELIQTQSLEEILATAALTPIFQPIVSLKNHQIYGYEALIRGPSNNPLHSPINLFNAAYRDGRLAELDLLCREIVIRQYGRLRLGSKLFINTIPAALLQQDYPHGLTLEFLRQAGLSPEQVIIELTEQYPIGDYDLMRTATDHYREMGFSIALDDLGAGHASLRTWSELKPDYVKIDRHFMQNIHEDQQKQQFVRSIIDIAQGIHCKIVGEGIEVREEYLSAQGMAMQFAQGYYFARPSGQPQRRIDAELFDKRQSPMFFVAGKPRGNTLVSSLLIPLTAVRIDQTVSQVGERFQRDPKLTALPVVHEDETVAGMVWRDDLMTLYASRYGRELHGRKPIRLFMDQNPLIAEVSLPLQALSKQITSQDASQQGSMFILTEEKYYRGVGSLMGLLRQITDMQLTIARHANPLSGLPGNVPLSEHTGEVIADRRDVAVCYFDLDNFKPYNDIYGYRQGDRVIRKTAKILTEHVDHNCDFLGHVGGDDFIILFDSPDWHSRCEQILKAFTDALPTFYRQEDIDVGGIRAPDRRGKIQLFPLLSLSIGAVRLLDFPAIVGEEDLAELASRAKSKAKKTTGNSLYQLPASDCQLPLSVNG